MINNKTKHEQYTIWWEKEVKYWKRKPTQQEINEYGLNPILLDVFDYFHQDHITREEQTILDEIRKRNTGVAKHG